MVSPLFFRCGSSDWSCAVGSISGTTFARRQPAANVSEATPILNLARALRKAVAKGKPSASKHCICVLRSSEPQRQPSNPESLPFAPTYSDTVHVLHTVGLVHLGRNRVAPAIGAGQHER